MQNVHGKEMDLLRVTVKVPGKRPPRAIPSGAPPAGQNGLVKDTPGPEGSGAGEREREREKERERERNGEGGIKRG